MGENAPGAASAGGCDPYFRSRRLQSLLPSHVSQTALCDTWLLIFRDGMSKRRQPKPTERVPYLPEPAGLGHHAVEIPARAGAEVLRRLGRDQSDRHRGAF